MGLEWPRRVGWRYEQAYERRREREEDGGLPWWWEKGELYERGCASFPARSYRPRICRESNRQPAGASVHRFFLSPSRSNALLLGPKDSSGAERSSALLNQGVESSAPFVSSEHYRALVFPCCSLQAKGTDRLQVSSRLALHGSLRWRGTNPHSGLCSCYVLQAY